MSMGHVRCNHISSYHLRCHFYAYFAVCAMNDAKHDGGPLKNDSCDQHVEADASEAISFQKCHQKPEPNEDHHMNVLKHCKNEFILRFQTNVSTPFGKNN